MFCDKCGMPLAICICNILPEVHDAGGQVLQITVQLENGAVIAIEPAPAEDGSK